MGRTWQETAKIAQDFRDNSIAEIQPPVPDVPTDLPLNVIALPRELLSEAEVSLTEKTTEELLQALATGTVSSTTVTLAFLRRAGLAQKLVSESAQHETFLMNSRQTASPSFFLLKLWNVRNISMTTLQSTSSQLDHCTVYPFP